MRRAETRALKHGMDMAAEIGFACDRKSNETLSRMAVHMDCMHWVNRDSYLPQGSRGLKVRTIAAEIGCCSSPDCRGLASECAMDGEHPLPRPSTSDNRPGHPTSPHPTRTHTCAHARRW